MNRYMNHYELQSSDHHHSYEIDVINMTTACGIGFSDHLIDLIVR